MDYTLTAADWNLITRALQHYRGQTKWNDSRDTHTYALATYAQTMATATAGISRAAETLEISREKIEWSNDE